MGVFVERVASVALKTTMTAVGRHRMERTWLSAHMVQVDAVECRVDCPGMDREHVARDRYWCYPPTATCWLAVGPGDHCKSTAASLIFRVTYLLAAGALF
jgi:hypothetical protein